MHPLALFALEDQALADYRAAKQTHADAWNAGREIGHAAIHAARARLDAIRARITAACDAEAYAERCAAIDHARLALDDA